MSGNKLINTYVHIIITLKNCSRQPYMHNADGVKERCDFSHRINNKTNPFMIHSTLFIPYIIKIISENLTQDCCTRKIQYKSIH